MSTVSEASMARTLDPAAHTLRRDEFVDVAQRLMRTRGYELMSVQGVLDELRASKGAFYHYFGGKADLLEAVVERMVDDATSELAPLFDDPQLSAPEKLNRWFSGIVTWKMQRKDLLLAIVQVWLADENAIVREKFRKHLVDRLAAPLAGVIEQGRQEGTFHVDSADATARVFISLMQAANEQAGALFVAREANEVTFEHAEQLLAAYATAFERVLGAPAGTYPQLDRSLLHEWFG